MKPHRQLPEVPCQRRRQRLGLVVELERREAAPRRVVARQFHHAAEEHQPEQQPPEEPHADRRGIREDRQEARFHQQHVPLEREKLLPHRTERKPQHDAERPGPSAARARKWPPGRTRRRRSTPPAAPRRRDSATRYSGCPNRRRAPTDAWIIRRYSAKGTIPREPISPGACNPNDVNAIKNTKPRNIRKVRTITGGAAESGCNPISDRFIQGNRLPLTRLIPPFHQESRHSMKYLFLSIG